jgi:acetylornithine deacetylase/succinyl-diaminopimelate desuccinylase-like protein
MYRYARSFPHAVATVGRIEIPNGSSNRVPDRTWFTLDLRSADAETMDGLIPHAKEVLLKMAEQNGSSVEVSISHFVPPIELDPELRNILNEKAHVLSDRVMGINSGAAHDSLVMAKYYPTAMLFVPSRGGRSHCPEESSRAEDLALAVDVLADALAEMDRNI